MVSIPNGTITGRIFRGKPHRIHEFQFQTVRLQENASVHIARPCKVSIPNGTITGHRSDGQKKADQRFQFQTVRLQDTVTEKVPADGFSFNSKRYDYRP